MAAWCNNRGHGRRVIYLHFHLGVFRDLSSFRAPDIVESTERMGATRESSRYDLHAQTTARLENNEAIKRLASETDAPRRSLYFV